MTEDKQVQEAFYHWLPRFMANLVIYEEGNHSINNFVYKMRPQAVDWLADRLVTSKKESQS